MIVCMCEIKEKITDEILIKLSFLLAEKTKNIKIYFLFCLCHTNSFKLNQNRNHFEIRVYAGVITQSNEEKKNLW